MPNVPSNDTSARLVPGIQTFCEWVVRLAGRIATCVESAEMVVDHVATHGRIPVTSAEDVALTQDLQSRGEADPDGATNSDAASAQMTRLGIANTHYHQAGNSFDWVGLIKAGIDRGVACVYGFNAAHLTFDDWTGQWTNQGVDGHGVAIVGYDATGAIVADPNTQQAADGNFVHYSWQRLLDAASGNPDIILPEVSLVLDITTVANYFTAEADGSWKCQKNGHVIHMGQLVYFRSLPFDETGLPLTDEFFPAAGVSAQVYERGIHIYDPDRKWDNPPGAVGPAYKGHIDDKRLNGVLIPPVVIDPKIAKEAAAGEALDTQLKADVATFDKATS